VKPESFPHTVLNLWQDFSAMMAISGIELLKIGLPVRVDLLMPTPWQEVERWGFLADFAEPSFGTANDWRSLGHDVCDESFCSGLTNCGYDEERAEWRIRWAPKLNDHGLLAGVGDAFEFCAATDLRVSEHAPFYVLDLLRPTYWPSAAVA
jgi:hypothetical protein